MKSKLLSLLAAFTLALGISAIPTAAQAYVVCKWVGAGYYHGVYHSAHKVCWKEGSGYYHGRYYYYDHGYYYGYKHCGYRYGQKICWSN